MKKCKREGCNNEQPSDRWDQFCSDNCGAIAMGEAMGRSFAGFSGIIIRPTKPEGEKKTVWVQKYIDGMYYEEEEEVNA